MNGKNQYRRGTFQTRFNHICKRENNVETTLVAVFCVEPLLRGELPGTGART